MMMKGKSVLFSLLAAAGALPLGGQESGISGIPEAKIQKIRFVEDDAQNQMASKIYELKNQKANDLVPFLLGAVKRYAKNSSADRINYAAGKSQLVAVSCPAPLLPYIDDMIRKLDRPGPKGPDGSGIDGTGILRSVYTPVWRSGESMMNIMVKAGIPSNADEGANQDAVVAFDAPTNRIYWKDSIRKNDDMKKYLVWLDRPLPQCTVKVRVYEVRESDLLDLGLDYLAWKNGPGLNLFEGGAAFLENSAMESAFGPYGFFMFAPAFDLSFVRILQQNGKASIASEASVTLINGKDASISFAPGYQNLTKDDKFATSVTVSENSAMNLKITAPVLSLTGDADSKTGRIGFSPDDYAKQRGILTFAWSLAMKNTVERDNRGNELREETEASGSVSVQSGAEHLLYAGTRTGETEQTVGVPFLCTLPVLKYIFGTTTRNRETVFCYVSVEPVNLHPDAEIAAVSGKLVSVPDLFNQSEKGK